MSTPRTIRMTRARRAAAITTAAVAVVLGPTACDSASAGGSGAYGAGQPQDSVDVVSVANEERDGANAGRREGRDREGQDREGRDGDGQDRNGRDRDGDGQDGNDREGENLTASEEKAAEAGEEADNGGDGAAERQENNGLDVLGRTCEGSDLPPHTGFQEGDRCSDTEFGEVGKAERNPSLLITDFPDEVDAGKEFTITVATKNLVRDRFLGAKDGGYYLESSFLNDQGLQRGHFHTACRLLESGEDEPQDPARVVEFFEATQDNKGSDQADEVTITVKGLDKPGRAQCAVWAGDGSHRIPMMERANQIPAFDAVRFTVK